ncbi:anti-sigma factor family protein [Prosthecomicrobium pneumaticum]|uniref:Anti-sigma factor RsiW n=1 Tax=Prosthecomicrobium pneumaticum TaxID=81895 RepID=A0A7W9CSZ7_9HYPH|nr:anti-sigma factor [Prosthecomicrobium pneumaticum]MBB5751365.1 anti-sigma factor RsiW [Prosthecomicrobium pneumaticum]
MDHPLDPITEADLQAYVEDQLPVARRIEVETHLCRSPDEAVRVMADLRVRDELRLALAEAPRAARVATTEAARRLERGLGRDRLVRQLRRIAAVAVLIAAGWLAHAEFGAFGVSPVVASAVPPAYVADAVRAHGTAHVRAAMASQPEVPRFDRAELRAATAIDLPALPQEWSVTDVQVFPSAFGPSVEVAIRTEALGPVSLFAVRPGGFDVVSASAVREGDLAAAYWQVGEVAYALVAAAEPEALRAAAGRLAPSFY